MPETIQEGDRVEKFSDRFVERQREAAEQVDEKYITTVREKLGVLDEDLKAGGVETSRTLFREEEIRYLALLEQKDSLTFDHSVGVVRVLLQELPEFKDDLQDEMHKEGITFETLLSAGALHDIGKLGLPDRILKSRMKNADLTLLLKEGLRNADPFIERRLHENGVLAENSLLDSIPQDTRHAFLLDPREYLSLGFIFKDDAEALQEFEAYGLDPTQTSFMDALKTHEEYSEQIVLGMESLEDRKEIAHLVGTHHNYKKKSVSKLEMSSEILRISEYATELLHLADVFHAIMQERPYQQKTSELEALGIIRDQTHKGVFIEKIAKRWIKRALQTLPEDEKAKNPKLFSDLVGYAHV